MRSHPVSSHGPHPTAEFHRFYSCDLHGSIDIRPIILTTILQHPQKEAIKRILLRTGTSSIWTCTPIPSSTISYNKNGPRRYPSCMSIPSNYGYTSVDKEALKWDNQQKNKEVLCTRFLQRLIPLPWEPTDFRHIGGLIEFLEDARRRLTLET